MSGPTQPSVTPERVAAWLRCPLTHGPLSVTGDQITSPGSGFKGSIRDDVVVMLPEESESFFDDKFHVMKHGKDNKGEWDFCYDRQTRLLTQAMKPGMRVLDVGCGPVLPYEKPPGVSIIGLEPSFYSIRENTQLDLRVFGSAYEIPLADASTDVIVCFYAIHHMVGRTVDETKANVEGAFREFARVLRPGGSLMVFEMTPGLPFRCVQAIYWNPLRRMIGNRLDMRFFSADELDEIGRGTMPAGSDFESTEFKVSAFTSFAPIFSLPQLKVPRFVYPLSPRLYKWQIPLA